MVGVSVALAFALGGCHSPTGTEALSVVTSLSPARFAPGAEVEIRVTVTNHGLRPRSIHVGPCGLVDVTTPDGAEVGRMDADCDGSINLLTLRAGEHTVLIRPWRGDIRIGDYPATTLLLEPGDYVLRSSIGVFGARTMTHQATVRSRPVTVTIVP